MSKITSLIEQVTASGKKQALAMHRHGFYGVNTLSELAQKHGSPAAIDTQVAKYSALLDELLVGVKIVATDGGLNALGKSKRRQALRDEVARQMATLDLNQERKITEDVKVATAGVEQVPGPAKPKELLEFMVHQEIRSDLKAMTSLDREAAVKSAAESGDTELVRAVVHAPRPLMSDRVRDEAIESWKRKVNPVAFDKLDAALEVQSTFRSNRTVAGKLLGKLVGTDPIETAAGPDAATAE